LLRRTLFFQSSALLIRISPVVRPLNTRFWGVAY